MKLLHEFFLKNVKENPENKAIIFPESFITYRDLYNISHLWAANIKNNINEKEMPLEKIAILGRKSLSAYAGELSSLYLGAAFIPLNPRFPIERLISILNVSKPTVIIADNGSIPCLLKIMKESTFKPTLVFLPEYEKDVEISNSKIITKNSIIIRDPFFEILPYNEEKIAYIMFTSGSTGNPKGVPISHKSVSAFINYNSTIYKLGPTDRFTQFFELTFDLSIFDIYMPLSLGAAICVPSDLDIVSPKAYVEKNNITVWFSAPSALSLYKTQSILSENDLNSIHLSLFCGEALDISLVYYWFKVCPQSIVENLYGPTELAICCSRYRCERDKEIAEYHGIVSIGSIYANLSYIILNEQENSFEKAQEFGELCVDGPQKFNGYLDPNNEFNTFYENYKTGKKYYKTGDVVKVLSDGNLLYLGRKDQQVKINGFRVEILEIESCLKKFGAVPDN